ncbi:HK97 gp10 family phage protein [Arthrobacter sp. SDTb3-6]|uniref:HK97 gp10 family phage protein n=1 Tax=Arthrobacter sp. SDTb3-6 TaxID=2713571 RepID=UPI00159E2AB3|nr:HK97 gp10 family phage protein [Arthrobacter sp. SDTb3-6]NVM97826.1 HK97 gp10 family phage protein [Arthrobacter sp. SDTb3-6]
MKWNEGFFSEVLNSAPVVGIVTGVAHKVEAEAKAAAPVDTGEYRDGIHVEVKRRGKRTVAVVVASSRHSMIVESRTGNLARALGRVAGGG